MSELADYRDCIELGGKICDAVENYDGDDLLHDAIIPCLRPIVGERDALESRLREVEAERDRLKAAASKF